MLIQYANTTSPFFILFFFLKKYLNVQMTKAQRQSCRKERASRFAKPDGKYYCAILQICRTFSGRITHGKKDSYDGANIPYVTNTQVA